jgi:hypothetical protein
MNEDGGRDFISFNYGAAGTGDQFGIVATIEFGFIVLYLSLSFLGPVCTKNRIH